MKQLIIAKSTSTLATAITDLTALNAGVFGLYDLTTKKAITAEPENNFSVILSRGTGEMPINFPEVDVKSLTVAKGSPKAAVAFKAVVTIPTTEKGKEYTIIVVKSGTVFNERSTWSFTHLAKSTTAADTAKALAESINANQENLGVTATASGATLTINGPADGANFNVLTADELTGTAVTITTGEKAILDKAFVQDLASRCAAGKGFNYTYSDGDSIYPGYPEEVEDTTYVLYTLRFAVPRVAAKQRDEVVYQRLHIAVPTGAALVASLDTIFGTAAASGASTASLLND